MVTQYGMSEKIGAVRFGEDNGQPFLGRDIGHSRNYSEEVAGTIDEEISTLIAKAHQEAFDILVDNRDVLDSLVVELMEKETLDKAQVARIFEPLRRREIRPAWTGSDSRTPSALPPVEVPHRNGASADVSGPEEGIVVGPDSGPDAPPIDQPQPGES